MSRIARRRARAHFVLGRVAGLFGLAAVTAGAGCSAGVDARQALGSQQQALGGIEGTFEYALDAPWRMEPRPVTTSTVTYSPIPLQMSIHDANEIGDDMGGMGAAPTIGYVCALAVTQGSTVTTIPVERFAEIERTHGSWSYPGTEQPSGPPREACTATSTTDCSLLRNASGTSEWHALATYAPTGAGPGSNIALTLDLKVSRSTAYDCGDADATHFYHLKNYVSVHYGEAALPRFGAGWSYGDLHYHSQGTDNEGESAYNYRGVARAMQAVGLDFLWATEHASAANQMVDVDVDIHADLSGNRDLRAKVKRGVLRDMDARRFQVLDGIVHEVNRQTALRAAPGPIATIGGQPPLSQIFLGGEVDVIPEARSSSAPIAYGDAKQYDLATLCGGWKSEVGYASASCDTGYFRCAPILWPGSSSCDPSHLTQNLYDGDYLIRDLQAINEFDYGREHIVYLPDPTRSDAFVGSFTGTYGGAKRRLVETRVEGSTTYGGVLPEVEAKSGSVFLAHHLNHGNGGKGPDGPPWSESMLDKAWRSSAVLGLEFWNEDARRVNDISDVAHVDGWEDGYQRDDEWCPDCPTSNPVLLELVEEARRALKPGADGLFSLQPWNLSTGMFTRWSKDVEHDLEDGSLSWDRLNMKGLNPGETKSLAWLPAGQPRRLFVAGGSDAHGDFNYRRTGYMEGTTGVTDMGIGTPRNLVLTGAPATSVDPSAPLVIGAGQALNALRAGHFSVTDGPALRMVVDSNKNGAIDDTDAQMGDMLDVTNQTQMSVLVEWNSTTEFGMLDSIELTVGALDGASGVGRIYRGGVGTGTAHGPSTSYTWNGFTYTHMADDVWFMAAPVTAPDQPTTQADHPLRIQFPDRTDGSTYFKGVRAFAIDLSKLVVDSSGKRADRLFVRALAMGQKKDPYADCAYANTDDARLGKCVRRYALTNPVWVRNHPLILAPTSPTTVLASP